MKSKLLILLAIIFCSLQISTVNAQYVVKGKATKDKDGSVVETGTAVGYVVDRRTKEPVQVGTGAVLNGIFSFVTTTYDSTFVAIFPNSELQDYVPTWNGNAQEWERDVAIFPNTNPLDIRVACTEASAFRPTGNSNGTDNNNATLKGRIKYNGSLEGAAVYAKKSNGKYYGYCISDADGNYTFLDLPNGQYQIIVSKIGYGSVTKPISMNGNDITMDIKVDKNFRLIGSGSNRPLSFETQIEMKNSNGNVIKLDQNFPNPFNPSTKISFEIANSSETSLKIFDMTGKMVAELVNGYLQPGTYSIDFNAINFPSGMYFYKLKANSVVLTKKMLLVK